MQVLSFLVSLVATWRCFAAQKHLRGCTAASAGRWNCLAAIGVTMVNAISAWQSYRPESQLQSLHSFLQYGAAVALLAGPIDLLGARRPGHEAWPWFVVVPMLIVLQWPSATQWYSGAADVPVEVPTPTFVGFLFVGLMGTGNFFGTTNTLATLLAAAGMVVIALPVSDLIAFESNLLPVGTFLLAVAVFRFRFPAKQRGAQNLWLDYRNLYGIVWAKRVADRVNQFQQVSTDGNRLTIDGYLDSKGHPAEWSESTIQRLAWVLRRFLDQEFLSGYLQRSHLADRDQFSGPAATSTNPSAKNNNDG